MKFPLIRKNGAHFVRLCGRQFHKNEDTDMKDPEQRYLEAITQQEKESRKSQKRELKRRPELSEDYFVGLKKKDQKQNQNQNSKRTISFDDL